MSTSKYKPAKLFHAVARQVGISHEQSGALLAALDDAGLVVMPTQPTGQLIEASLVAMRKSRRALPVNREAAQRMKHEIRYRAMIEKQREGLHLERLDCGGKVGVAAADRAISAVTNR